jgi:hypothetical protein
VITDIRDPQCDIKKLFEDFYFWFVWSYVNSSNFRVRDVASWLHYVRDKGFIYDADPFLFNQLMVDAHELCDVWFACKVIRVFKEYNTCILYEVVE